MRTDPKVEITKVANGFIVDVEPAMGGQPKPSEFMQILPGVINNVLKTLIPREDDDEDPVMSRIKQQQQDEQSEVKSTIHIFKTWREVATFLQQHFEK